MMAAGVGVATKTARTASAALRPPPLMETGTVWGLRMRSGGAAEAQRQRQREVTASGALQRGISDGEPGAGQQNVRPKHGAVIERGAGKDEIHARERRRRQAAAPARCAATSTAASPHPRAPSTMCSNTLAT